MDSNFIRLAAICDEADRLAAARRGQRFPRRKLGALDFALEGRRVWDATVELVKTVRHTEGGVTYISNAGREDWDVALHLASEMAQEFA